MTFVRLALLALLAGCAPATPEAAPEGPKLSLPIACAIGTSCEVQHYVDRDAGPGVSDYRCGHRTYDGHNGLDIRLHDLAAMKGGVAVLAAADGRVARLRDGMADVSARAADAPVVAGQECGNGVVVDHGGGWETQYCHLARGSVQVKVGESVRAGQPIARVGLSGDTEFPHVHLTVRHEGVVVDPFAPDPYVPVCQGQPGLWTKAAAAELAYKPGAVLNVGFTSAAFDMPKLEAGGLTSPDASSPALIAYARAIGLAAGDVQELTLTAPDGTVLATQRLAPLERDKAQYMMFVGKKRPAAGWPPGAYRAAYSVRRKGSVVIERAFSVTL